MVLLDRHIESMGMSSFVPNKFRDPRPMGAVSPHFRLRTTTARHARLTEWAVRLGFCG